LRGGFAFVPRRSARRNPCVSYGLKAGIEDKLEQPQSGYFVNNRFIPKNVPMYKSELRPFSSRSNLQK
jgi:hypothetical protein